MDKILANSLRYVPSLLKSIQLEVENQYGDRLKRNPTILGSKFSNTFEEILSDLDQTYVIIYSILMHDLTPLDLRNRQVNQLWLLHLKTNLRHSLKR